MEAVLFNETRLQQTNFAICPENSDAQSYALSLFFYSVI
jgi:hypothetical protein